MCLGRRRTKAAALLSAITLKLEAKAAALLFDVAAKAPRARVEVGESSQRRCGRCFNVEARVR